MNWLEKELNRVNEILNELHNVNQMFADSISVSEIRQFVDSNVTLVEEELNSDDWGFVSDMILYYEGKQDAYMNCILKLKEHGKKST